MRILCGNDVYVDLPRIGQEIRGIGLKGPRVELIALSGSTDTHTCPY